MHRGTEATCSWEIQQNIEPAGFIRRERLPRKKAIPRFSKNEAELQARGSILVGAVEGQSEAHASLKNVWAELPPPVRGWKEAGLKKYLVYTTRWVQFCLGLFLFRLRSAVRWGAKAETQLRQTFAGRVREVNAFERRRHAENLVGKVTEEEMQTVLTIISSIKYIKL